MSLREKLAEAICDAMNMNRVGRLEIEAADAVLSVLTTLAEDEETVERVARAMYNSRIVGSVGYSEFDDLSTNGFHDTYLQEVENARAALRALKDTKP